MPTPNPADKATSKPIILTSFTQAGVRTLNLATVPRPLLVSIAAAALAVCAEWGNGGITPEYPDAQSALSDLESAAGALDALYLPTVPAREDLENYGLTVADDDQGYPVIRNGLIHLVKAADLTELESVAVRQWLTFSAEAAAQSSASFKTRAAQFDAETGKAPTQGDAEYVVAPAPDWRLA